MSHSGHKKLKYSEATSNISRKLSPTLMTGYNKIYYKIIESVPGRSLHPAE